MRATLIKVVDVFIFLTVLLVHPQSPAAQPIKRKSNFKFYVVSVPIGYGALSAYHALPSALAHAPYALRGLDRSLNTKIGSVRTLDFENEEEGKTASANEMNRPNYSLDLPTFVKLFAHEFQDEEGNEKIIKNISGAKGF